MQITDTILLVRPASFGYNAETAATNFFQHSTPLPPAALQQKALAEFGALADLLQQHGINVIIVDDTAEPPKPDAVFPNNWISTTPDGTVCVFPMQAASRRPERRSDVVDLLANRFFVNKVEDWSLYENEGLFLEGTGSLVIDHAHRIVYAALSARTHPAMVERFAAAHSYRAIPFGAYDEKGQPIYHTNVLLSVGETLAVLCPKAIADHTERVAVAQLLEATGHETMYISPQQLSAFAGNILQVCNTKGQRFVVVSRTAYDSLDAVQRQRLGAHGELLVADVSTIERVEGGSVRCMMAEIFLPRR